MHIEIHIRTYTHIIMRTYRQTYIHTYIHIHTSQTAFFHFCLWEWVYPPQGKSGLAMRDYMHTYVHAM